MSQQKETKFFTPQKNESDSKKSFTPSAEPIEAKIVLLGNSGVGKTSLVMRFIHHQFSSNLNSTIGASYLDKIVNYNGQQVKLQMWDTAGQERFRSLAPMYYRGASMALLIFDVTNEDSWKSVQHWVTELQNNTQDEHQLVFIIGNQIDKEKRVVDRDKVLEYAESINAFYYETSAKENLGVEELQDDMVALLVESSHQLQEEAKIEKEKKNLAEISSTTPTKSPPGQGGCCK